MGSGYNLPDGCYDSDLPGYHDYEETVSVICPECDREFDYDVYYDKRDETYGVECEKHYGGCGHKWSQYTPLGYRRAYTPDNYDDYYG